MPCPTPSVCPFLPRALAHPSMGSYSRCRASHEPCTSTGRAPRSSACVRGAFGCLSSCLLLPSDWVRETDHHIHILFYYFLFLIVVYTVLSPSLTWRMNISSAMRSSLRSKKLPRRWATSCTRSCMSAAPSLLNLRSRSTPRTSSSVWRFKLTLTSAEQV